MRRYAAFSDVGESETIEGSRNHQLAIVHL